MTTTHPGKTEFGRSAKAMRGVGVLFVVFGLGAGLVFGRASCATSSGSGTSATKKTRDPSRGYQTLEATVVGREYEPPGSGGTSYAGDGTYYLVFEAREGEANASYRFPVTRAQYQRYVEGSHVQLSIANHDLRDIRPIR